MAKIAFKGNIGKEIKMVESKGGEKFLAFDVHTSKLVEEGGKLVPKYEQWYGVTVNGERAELYAKVLQTGMTVSVKGTLTVNAFKTNEGEAKADLGVLAESVDIVITNRVEGVTLAPAKEVAAS